MSNASVNAGKNVMFDKTKSKFVKVKTKKRKRKKK